MPIQNMNTRAARRALTRETLIHPEVRTFYESLTTMIQTRAQNGSLSSTELVIPEIVMDRIEDRMGDYATVANEVETLNVGGTSRVILDGADPEAVWVEQSGAISQIFARNSSAETRTSDAYPGASRSQELSTAVR